jgi:hypothetical protein
LSNSTTAYEIVPRHEAYTDYAASTKWCKLVGRDPAGIGVASEIKQRGRVSLGGDIVHDCTVVEVTDKFARVIKEHHAIWPPVVH